MTSGRRPHRPPRAVVFDLDGTLVDSAADIADALNAALARHGLRPLAVEQVRGLLGGGARELVAGALQAAGGGPELLAAVLGAYSSAYRRTPVARTVPYPGAREALRLLKERGIAVGVCTNKRSALARTVLAGTGLAPFVDAVVGIDDVPAGKPDPGHLAAALAALGAGPGAAVYVGDTRIDALAARRLGVPYRHVAWGEPVPGSIPLADFFDDFAALAAQLAAPPSAGTAAARTPPGGTTMQPRTDSEKAKWAAGIGAIETYVRDGMRLGLGSGTTSHWFVRALGAAVADGLDVVGVPTSTGTRDLARQAGVPLTTLADVERLDLTVDGADEIDHDGAMIKGGGACLLWERIVADASDRMVAVVDDSKVVATLGAFPLPVEVVPYAWESTTRSIARLLVSLGHDAPGLRRRERDGEPVVTDSGNFIVDAHLKAITEPLALDGQLNWIPGVVENGLFTGIADEMVVGFAGGRYEVRDVSAAATARPATTVRGRRA